MGEDRLPKIWNYKYRGERVRGRTRRGWKDDFEAGEGRH
jgi:hypothetical protein